MQRGALRLGAIAMLGFACGLALSCGGGGGGPLPPINTGLVATFTPDNASPGANTLNMTAGAANGDEFDVEVRVTGITDFFGAAFRLNYDPSTATFLGYDSAGSLIAGGAATNFNAVPGVAGELLINATLQGQVQGVTPAGTDLLITLSFRATSATAGNAFAFGPAATRLVTTCPAPPAACADVPDANLTWSGGTLTAN